MNNIEPLIDDINKITENQYKFMLKSATLFEDADFCVIEIFYKDGIRLEKEIKDKVQNKILEISPKKFKYEIRFIKFFISEERIFENVQEFMEKNYNSIFFLLKSVKKTDMKFFIDLTVDEMTYEHASQKNLCLKIQDYLKNLYDEYDFECGLNIDNVYKKDENELIKENYKEDEVDFYEFRKFEFLNPSPLFGEIFNDPATYIMDKTQAEENVVICGKVKNIKSFVLKKKPKPIENSENSNDFQQDNMVQNLEQEILDKNELIDEKLETSNETKTQPKYERKLYKWGLEDFTGTITCTFLSNKENQPFLETLENESIIAVKGKIQKDNFTNAMICSVKNIEYCEIPENLEEYIVYKTEKPFYEFVKPEPLKIYRQDDLMNFSIEQEVPKYLTGKIFVCFDFETTGLHYDDGDRIVEIGAVKIVDGKITEKFGSYVNPNGRHIDAKASETTGIYDEDVANALMDYQVLQDFYKFTRGAILIGYNNINFDNVFLYGQAKKCRYNFDNQVEDVFRIAQKNVKGVKNYKLGTIAEKLGVVLDNAHSAVYDALATAEVFIKLAEQLS